MVFMPIAYFLRMTAKVLQQDHVIAKNPKELRNGKRKQTQKVFTLKFIRSIGKRST